MTREELSQMVELLRDTAKLHQPNEEILTDVKAENFIFVMESVLSALSVPNGEYIKKEDIKEFLFNEGIYGYERRIDELPTYSVPEREKGDFDGMTNGEVFQAIFPCDVVDVNGLQEGYVHFSMKSNLESMDCFALEWWNAPYKVEREEV